MVRQRHLYDSMLYSNARTCARSLTTQCFASARGTRCIRIGWLWVPFGLFLALFFAPFFCSAMLCGEAPSGFQGFLGLITMIGGVVALIWVFVEWEPVEALGL